MRIKTMAALGLAVLLTGCSASAPPGASQSSELPPATEMAQPSLQMGDTLDTEFGPLTLVHLQAQTIPLATENGTITDTPSLSIFFEFTNTTNDAIQPYAPLGSFLFSPDDNHGQDISEWASSAVGYSDIEPGQTTIISPMMAPEVPGTIYVATVKGTKIETVGAFLIEPTDVSSETLSGGSIVTERWIVEGAGVVTKDGERMFRYRVLSMDNVSMAEYCAQGALFLSVGEEDLTGTAIDRACGDQPSSLEDYWHLPLPDERGPLSVKVYSPGQDNTTLQLVGSFIIRASELSTD